MVCISSLFEKSVDTFRFDTSSSTLLVDPCDSWSIKAIAISKTFFWWLFKLSLRVSSFSIWSRAPPLRLSCEVTESGGERRSCADVAVPIEPVSFLLRFAGGGDMSSRVLETVLDLAVADGGAAPGDGALTSVERTVFSSVANFSTRALIFSSLYPLSAASSHYLPLAIDSRPNSRMRRLLLSRPHTRHTRSCAIPTRILAIAFDLQRFSTIQFTEASHVPYANDTSHRQECRRGEPSSLRAL
jgi:hypothetical protein